MDKKDKKIYAAAIKAYGNGELDKALKICEKGISKNLKNAPLINLKGLLLYLDGKLKEAQGVWKLNKDTNKDAVAEKYLENIDEDWNKYILYKEAGALIDKIKIHAAEEKLLKCSESSFNQIAVSNLLAVCYLKKGEYDKCKLWLSKALTINKYNKDSLKIKNELITIGIEKKKINMKPIIISMVAIIIVGIVAVGSLEFIKKGNNIAKVKEETKKKEVKVTENKDINQSKEKIEQPKKVEQPKETEVKPLPNLQNAINNDDYMAIYDYLTKTKNMDLSMNDKALRNQAEEILRSRGAEVLYKLGSQDMKAKKFGDAITFFNMAEDYSDQSELYPHLIYLKAISLQNVGNVEQAAQYFIKYIDKYHKGDYEAECLYRLVIIYKDIDKEKAKGYANRIISDYSDSMYNNSTVQSILKQ